HEVPAPQVLADLGNLLLMFLLAWSYLAFMQYLTIWSADLPAETAWYIPRTLTSWRFVAWLLIALNLAAPFPILLARRAKRRRGWLAGVAALLLLGALIHASWLVLPTFRPHGFALRLSDLCAVLGMGALWLAVYSRALRSAQRTLELSGPRPTTLGSELV